jgi:hypothetical protein
MAKQPVKKAAVKKAAVKKPVKKAAPVRKAPVRRAAPQRAIVPAGHKFDDMIVDGGVDEAATVSKGSLSTYNTSPVLDSQDLFIPRLRLAQGLTAEVQNGEAKPGQWLVLGHEPMQECNIIPVAMTRRRELRDPDSRTTVCRSGDSLNGVGNPGGECALCPEADWSAPNKKNGKNLPPNCTFFYSYMVYVVEAETLAILEFSRTSITSGKMLNTIIVQHGIGTFAVRLASIKKDGNAGTFYSPVVNQTTAKAEWLKKAQKESGSAM